MKSKIRLIEIKDIIDKRIPECGEIDCNVCKTRHLYIANDILSLLLSKEKEENK